MHSMEELFFQLGRSKWDTLCSWCFHNFQKNENITLLHFKRKRKNNLSKIHTDILWSIVSIFWLLLCKSKIHWCHAYCSLPRSRCLVSVTQHLLFLIWESTIVWQDQITVGKEIMLTAVPLTERNQNYWSTVSRLKNILSGNFTAKSRLKRPQPKIRCDLVWAKIHWAREKDDISMRAPWLVVAHLDYSCRKNN